MRVPLLVPLVALLAIGFSGCIEGDFDSDTHAGGQNNIGVSSVKGAFSLGGQAHAHSKSYTYDWENGQTEATVTFGGQAQAGAFRVTIFDALGVQVYDQEFSDANQGVTEDTDRGAFGKWQVKVRFQDYTGNVGLSIYSA